METASQGWVLRWQGTKNKSGSIYLVYLDPTFLNLWDSINWSPGLAAWLLIKDCPYWELGPKKRAHFFLSLFVLCVTLLHIFFRVLPSLYWLPPNPILPSPGLIKHLSAPRPWFPKRAVPPYPAFFTTDLLKFGMCVQEALILGNN